LKHFERCRHMLIKNRFALIRVKFQYQIGLRHDGKRKSRKLGLCCKCFQNKNKKQASILLLQSKQQLKEYLLVQAANEIGFLNTLYDGKRSDVELNEINLVHGNMLFFVLDYFSFWSLSKKTWGFLDGTSVSTRHYG